MNPARDDERHIRSIWAMLLRIALCYPDAASMIEHAARGLIDDFRIARIFAQLRECHESGMTIDPRGVSIVIQGHELRTWFEGAVLAHVGDYPCDEWEIESVAERCMRELQRIRAARNVVLLETRAREALAAGREDEYKGLLHEQEKARREAKTIRY